MVDAKLFVQILNDKNFNNLKKLEFKYGSETIQESIKILKSTVYKEICIKDFNNNFLVYCPSLINISDNTYKSLLSSNNNKYSTTKLEKEISATLEIENIESSRSSIRNILKGFAPKDSSENKIYGIKKGLDFISNKTNSITEENLNKLYHIVMANNLESNEFLINNNYYRHDKVFIVGNKISHEGLNHKLLPEYMKSFINFINAKDNVNIIIKSIAIHFYFCYLHPYFNGNGRIARILQLWYLIQNNFNTCFLATFSQFISKTKEKYYKSFELIEENLKISNVLDITPFILYFNQHVFSNLKYQTQDENLLEIFNNYLSKGKITSKEKELFSFVLSNYSDAEFSTKQLEKDYQNAAYATIRSFVIKFESFNLLTSQKYTNKTKYKLNYEL